MSPRLRFLVWLGASLLALFCGLANEQYIELRAVDPQRAVDSELVLARGFPEAWLVVEQTGPPRTSGVIAWPNLWKSLCFFLALGAVALSAIRAVVRYLTSAPRLSQPSTALRLVALLSSGAGAAAYTYLLVGIANYWLLMAGTCIAMLPLALIRSAQDIGRLWLPIAALFLTALLAVASSFEMLAWVAIPFLVVFLLVAVSVGFAFLYWLTPRLS